MRRFIFASHHYLAYGLKDTVDFLTNKAKTIYDINAYAEDKEQNLESRVKDEVIVLTDLLGGSVYQKFYPYISERVHVLCGMNLPMAMSMVLAQEDVPFSEKRISEILEECKNQIVYVNALRCASTMDGDDE